MAEFHISDDGQYVSIRDGANFIGRLSAEVRPNGWTPHYQIYQAHSKRQGLMTKAMDLMCSHMGLEGLVWSATVNYTGNGFCSEEGRAFARAYAHRRGLPQPQWKDDEKDTQS